MQCAFPSHLMYVYPPDGRKKTHHLAPRGRKLRLLWFLTIPFPQILLFLRTVLSTRTPSSSCSATLRFGNFIGMILLGETPGIRSYFEKSSTPSYSRKKSSSSNVFPETSFAGALMIARMASENIDGFRSCPRCSSVRESWVAADSIACVRE